MKTKVLRRKLWGTLSVIFSTFLVIIIGGYEILASQSGTINATLNVNNSSLEYSDDPQYRYFTNDYDHGTYTGDYEEVKSQFVKVAEEVESEGIVLLRNRNDILPLAKGEQVSTLLSGSNYFSYSTSGSGGTTGDSDFHTLKQALEMAGLAVNEEIWAFYENVEERDEKLINDASFYEIPADVQASIEDTTAIVTISRSAGEGSDMPSARSDGHDRSYLSLNENELSVLEELTLLKRNEKIKGIVVLLNTSATLQLDFLDGLTAADGTPYDIDVDACIWVGNVGSAIDAVAKILVGDYVPSGKLSDTYLKNNFASPAGMQLTFNNPDTVSMKRFAQIYSGAEEAGMNESN
ncbi:MAG: glycoside hydrolase family 3 C-terminal domain-containing protein, partial [Parasporobacterium sp.]|nr:glycoside hydrolase family 3 C-terminal domain-containing protein [Parasporobacterium sp.]